MTKVTLALALTLATGCAVDVTGNATVLVGSDIAVKDRELCDFYDWLNVRSFRQEVPYIAPVAGEASAVVDGQLEAWQGESVLCGPDTVVVDEVTGDVVETIPNPCSSMPGDTWVAALQELHRSDGTVELGAFGRDRKSVV